VVRGELNAPIYLEGRPSSQTLLKDVAAGDRLALQKLFVRYNVRVFRFLLRMVGDEAVAEELMNEVFLEVWQHTGRYERRSSPLTWMLAIGHNKAISTLRKRREVTGLADEEMPEITDPADSPELTAQKQDESRLIRACIDRLSVEHRIILDLVYYHERSIAEVSKILNIPENTVKTRMFYARKKLSEALKARGIDRGRR
jgi:RNA polymerase sigma-70 factor (ECF subfamily)